MDGFYFGYNNAAFSVLRIQNGTPNWTAQTAWNGDKMNGTGPSGMTLVPTNGNVYSIEYQWLGFGQINFFIASTTTGQPILVHRIQYPNTAILPSVYNPSFPLTAKVINSGNTSNLVLKTSSAMAFCEGDGFSAAITSRNSVNSSVAFTSPTNQNSLTLLNSSTFAGKTNRVRVGLDFVSVSNQGNKPAFFSIFRNATFGTALTYTQVNVNTSVIQYSTTTSTITAGQQILGFENTVNQAISQILDSLQIFLNPTETLTLSVTSTANSQIDSSFSWKEMW